LYFNYEHKSVFILGFNTRAVKLQNFVSEYLNIEV